MSSGDLLYCCHVVGVYVLLSHTGMHALCKLRSVCADTCLAAVFQERPDAILPTMGGQTGLNLAKNLAEVSP